MHRANHRRLSVSSGARSKSRDRGPLMNDLPVYMIVNLQVTDADTYRIYEKGFFGLLKKYEGHFVTFDDDPVTFEGLAPRQGRMIIFQFPSEEKARNWFDDPEYLLLSENRRAGTKLEFLTMVRGLPPRQ
jgi:uncharacterized protein (DUF1330 family)